MIFVKHRSPVSPLLLVLLLLLVLAFVTLPADAALTPVYMHYYCRQQCEQRFKLCVMGASESPFLPQPCILLGLSYFHVSVSYSHEWLVSALVLMDLDHGIISFEGGIKSVIRPEMDFAVLTPPFRTCNTPMFHTLYYIFLVIMCCWIV